MTLPVGIFSIFSLLVGHRNGLKIILAFLVGGSQNHSCCKKRRMASPISFLLGMSASNFLRIKFDNQLFRHDTNRLSQRWRYSFDPFGHEDVTEVLLHWDLVLSTSACRKPCWSHKCCRRPDMWCQKLDHWSDFFWMETTGYEGQKDRKDLDMMPERPACPCVYLYSSHWQSINRQHFAGCLNTSLRGCLRRTLDGLDYWLTLGLTAGKPGMEESWKTGDLMSWRIKVGWHYLIQLLAVPSPIKFATQITKNAAELQINLLKFTLLWSMKFHSYLKVINQSTSIFTRLKSHETTTSSNFLVATNWQVASRIRSKYLLEEEHTASRYWTRHMVCRTIPSPWWQSGGKQQIQWWIFLLGQDERLEHQLLMRPNHIPNNPPNVLVCLNGLGQTTPFETYEHMNT